VSECPLTGSTALDSALQSTELLSGVQAEQVVSGETARDMLTQQVRIGQFSERLAGLGRRLADETCGSGS
jgi:hypothetical protein